MLADARPAAGFASASYAVVLADARSNPSSFALSLPLPFNFTLSVFVSFRPLVLLALAAPAFVLFFDYSKSALELEDSALRLPPAILRECEKEKQRKCMLARENKTRERWRMLA